MLTGKRRGKDQEELASISRSTEHTFMTVKKGIQRDASAGQRNIISDAALDIHQNTVRIHLLRSGFWDT